MNMNDLAGITKQEHHLLLIEIRDLQAERNDLADALREIAALPQPALQGGRNFFEDARRIARAALDRHTQQ